MIIRYKEKKIVDEEVNPLEWPENYYSELDPEKRLELLEKQLKISAGSDLGNYTAIFQARYEKQKSGGYADRFLEGWLELSFMAKNRTSKMLLKGNRKKAAKILSLWDGDNALPWGKELVVAELKHLAATYITACLSDQTYRSVLLNMGKMKDEKVVQKIREDLDQVTVKLPQALGMQEEFQMFTEAVMDVEDKLI